MDYSKFSTEDLQALQSGDLSAVSTEGLELLQQEMRVPAQTSPTQQATVLEDIPQRNIQPPAVNPDVQAAQENIQTVAAEQELVALGLMSEEDRLSTIVNRDWTETLGASLNDVLRMGGGMAGAEAGMRLTAGIPHPYAKAAGGVLGAGLGAFGGEFLTQSVKGTAFPESFMASWEAGKEDALYTIGGVAAMETLFRLGPGVMSTVLGVDLGKAQELMAVADKYKAALGVADVSRFAPVRGVKQIFGMFPWTGTPFRKAGVQTQQAVTGAVESRLELLAPNASLASLGIDMAAAARNTRREIKTVADALYTSADEYAEMNGALVPVQDLIQAAKDITPRMDLPPVKPGKPGIPQGEPVNSTTSMANLVQGIVDMEPFYATVPQIRNLQRRINEVFKAGGENFTDIDRARLYKLRLATESALMSAVHIDPAIAEETVRRYQEANEFYSMQMSRFSTPVADKFRAVDKNIFRTGFQKNGTITEDLLVDRVLKFDSPQMVKDLQALVGEDLVAAGARRHLENAWEQAVSTSPDGLDTVNFNVLFGAVGESGTRVNKAALAQALAPKGVEVNDFVEILSLAQNAGKVPMANKFVARRVALGGAASGLRALLGLGGAGAAVGAAAAFGPQGAVIGPLLTFAMSRMGTEALQSKRFLKLLINAKDPRVSEGVRAGYLTAALDYVMQEAPLTKEEMKEAWMEAKNAGTGTSQAQ